MEYMQTTPSSLIWILCLSVFSIFILIFFTDFPAISSIFTFFHLNNILYLVLKVILFNFLDNINLYYLFPNNFPFSILGTSSPFTFVTSSKILYLLQYLMKYLNVPNTRYSFYIFSTII